MANLFKHVSTTSGCGDDVKNVSKTKVNNEQKASESDIGRRANPVPVGETKAISDWIYSNGKEDYSAVVNVTIHEMKRGKSVYQEALSQNQYNKAPMDGYEYIALKVSVELVEAETEDYALFVSEGDFQFISTEGSSYEFTSLVYEPELRAEIYTGGSTSGYVIGQVKIGDDVLVVYEDAEWNNVFFATK